MFGSGATRLVLAAVVSLCAGSQACQLGVVSPTPPVCRTDFDCALSDVCIVGSCVTVARGESFDLQLTPPNDSQYAQQQLTDVRVDSRVNAVPDIFLKTAVGFSGSVLLEGGTDPAGVRARVEARRAGAIGGTYVYASALTVVSPTTNRHTFTLRLDPGSYDISVFPEDPELPPLPNVARVELHSSAVTRDIVLPAKSSFRRIAGIVVRQDGSREPVAETLVQAFTPAGVPASTIARTFSEGRFSISTLPVDGTYTLRVWRAEGGPNVPTVEKHNVVVVSSGVDAGLIALGAYEAPVALTGVVRGKTGDGDTLVGGANVEISGQVGNGRWKEQVTTSSAGELKAMVPPGRYTVEIRPPSDGDFAFFTGSLVVSAAGREDWTLARKARLTGTITAQDGSAVAGLFVQATRKSALGSGSDTLRYVKGVATREGGSYELLLDPGVYDLAFVPDSRPLARADLSGFAVQEGDQRHDQRLPPGVAVVGVVRDLAGRVFPGVAVEVYQGGASPARILGTGVTDAGGWYRVVVPASPAAAARGLSNARR